MTSHGRTLTDYKNVMTKDVLSLPHLLRGEQLLSSLPRESEAILSRGPRQRWPGAPSPCPDCPPARQASSGYGGASWKLRSGLSGLPRPQPYRHGTPGWACHRPSGAHTFPAPPLRSRAAHCHGPPFVPCSRIFTWRFPVEAELCPVFAVERALLQPSYLGVCVSE